MAGWEQASILGIVGFAIVQAYLAINLDEEHVIAKYIFFVTTITTMLIGSKLMIDVMIENSALAASQSTVELFYWLFTFLIVILLIYFISYFFIKKGKEVMKGIDEVFKNK